MRGSDGDGDLPLDRSGVEVPHCRCYLVQRVGAVDAGGHGAGGEMVGEDLQVAGPLLGGQADQPLADERGQDRARNCRPMPPVRLPLLSPPTMTAVPVGVSARRSLDSGELPAMSMIRS